jgi:hypothetical protein
MIQSPLPVDRSHMKSHQEDGQAVGLHGRRLSGNRFSNLGNLRLSLPVWYKNQQQPILC